MTCRMCGAEHASDANPIEFRHVAMAFLTFAGDSLVLAARRRGEPMCLAVCYCDDCMRESGCNTKPVRGVARQRIHCGLLRVLEDFDAARMSLHETRDKILAFGFGCIIIEVPECLVGPTDAYFASRR